MTTGDEIDLLSHMQAVPANMLLPRTQPKRDESVFGKRLSLNGPSSEARQVPVDVRGDPKVTYADGQLVAFDLDGVTKGTGRIRGRAVENIIDFWIVEVVKAEGIDPSMYPWSCISIPHTLLKPIR